MFRADNGNYRGFNEIEEECDGTGNDQSQVFFVPGRQKNARSDPNAKSKTPPDPTAKATWSKNQHR
jgi:hypothetical protein